MKIWKMKKLTITVISLVVLSLIGFTVSLTVGGSEQDEALAQEGQTYTVQSGNLAVEITAGSNLELGRTEELVFEVAGTVAEVLVEEGDLVEEGQVLAILDQEEWEDNLETLQDKLTAAERSLTDKEHALVSAERKVIDLEREVADKEDAITEAERQVSAKEFAVLQAELNAQTAEYNLNQIEDVKEAQEDVEQAEDNLDFVKKVLAGEFGGGFTVSDIQYWWQLEENAEEDLEYAQEELEEVLAGTSTTITNSSDAEAIILEISKKQLQIEQEKMDLEDAQIDVGYAQKAVDDAKYVLEKAQLNVEDAIKDVEEANLDIEDSIRAVENAQSDLDKALNTSLKVVAPFNGFVTRVNVEGGDEVMKGTVAVQLADPDIFEAAILVGETDITQLKEGVEATVQVDALSSLTLPAMVTHISPTATIQSGVVNYNVKVEVSSLEEMLQEQEAARQETIEKLQQGGLPENLKLAIEEGRMTQEEAEERMQQMLEGMQNQTAQAPTAVQEDNQLRDGLSVTVTIVVKEANDVLLVPNAAIISQRGQTYVQVVSPDATIEQRNITAGINDAQYTEVTDGLSEGEQIIIPEGTATAPTTSSTSQQRPPGGGTFIPGMGGRPQ